MIELEQQVMIERHDNDGWGRRQEFQSVWVSPHRIESISVVGITRLRMISGDVIDVRQTPEEILILSFGEPIRMGSYRNISKGATS